MNTLNEIMDFLGESYNMESGATQQFSNSKGKYRVITDISGSDNKRMYEFLRMVLPYIVSIQYEPLYSGFLFPKVLTIALKENWRKLKNAEFWYIQFKFDGTSSENAKILKMIKSVYNELTSRTRNIYFYTESEYKAILINLTFIEGSSQRITILTEPFDDFYNCYVDLLISKPDYIPLPWDFRRGDIIRIGMSELEVTQFKLFLVENSIKFTVKSYEQTVKA